MINNDKDCAINNFDRMNRRCKNDAFWIANGWCRLSCYKSGNGYLGDACCDESPSNCLLAGQALYEGGYLESSSGHRVVLESNGLVCIYDKADYDVPVWCIKQSESRVPGQLLNQDFDGNIVAYNSSSSAYWDTGTLTTGNDPFNPLFGYLVIQNDRNLVYYRSSGSNAFYSCDSEIGIDENGSENVCQIVTCTEDDCSNACVREPISGCYTYVGYGYCMYGSGSSSEYYEQAGSGLSPNECGQICERAYGGDPKFAGINFVPQDGICRCLFDSGTITSASEDQTEICYRYESASCSCSDTECPLDWICEAPSCNADTSTCSYEPIIGCATLDIWNVPPFPSSTSLASLTGLAAYPDNPDTTLILADCLEAPTNYADNFGSRLQTWIIPTFDCDYTFYIASDDHSQLNLSTDTDPANKQTIAFVTGYTGSREWYKYASQRSNPISLVSGNVYYLEALHWEAGGGDNLAIAWSCASQSVPVQIIGIGQSACSRR